MKEIFLDIGKEPLEKIKEFMSMLYNANLSESWHWFDKLDCSKSWARQIDDEMTFEKYLENASTMTTMILGRRELKPGTLDYITTISLFMRSVHLSKWMLPCLFEDVLKERYGHELSDWIFYDESRVNLKSDDVFKRWKKLNGFIGKLSLPDEFSERLPEIINEQLPKRLGGFIILERENIERFFWYFCPYNEPNYKTINEFFKQAYGTDIKDYK